MSRRDAADPSKPMGPRRERHKGKPEGGPSKRFKDGGKGPNTRPTRKPPPKS
jgi:hypothetical protein